MHDVGRKQVDAGTDVGGAIPATARPPATVTTFPPADDDTASPATVLPVAAIDDAAPPARVRRPADGLQLLVLLTGITLVLVLSRFAPQTTTGIETDLNTASGLLPAALLAIGSTVVFFGNVVLPAAVVADQLLRREGRFLLDALLATALSVVVANLLGNLLTEVATRDMLNALTGNPLGDGTPAAPIYPVVAFLTAGRLELRAAWQKLAWLLATLVVIAPVLSNDVTTLAAALGVLVARSSGLAVRWALGRPSLRPWGEQVVAALRRARVEPAVVRRDPESDAVSRAYAVDTLDGRRLDAVVLDRDRQAAGLAYRLYRRVRLRGPINRRAVLSMRQAVDEEALHAYAAHAAGVHTPRLVAVTDVGPHAAMLVYEHVDGTLLADLDAGGVTDDLLAAVWAELHVLHTARVAHRGLTVDGVLVDASGQPWLLDLRNGEVAATDLQLRLDYAQLVATTALVVGADRAADAALVALGAQEAAAVVPLLQPIALARDTSEALRRERELLPRLRERLTAAAPEVNAPQVNLSRLDLRTAVSIVGIATALYLVLTQLASVDLGDLIARAQPGWVALALTVSVVSFVGAALSLIAFTPGRLRLARTVWVQVATSFVNLISPPTVATSALNVRYVQRQGVPLGVAVASVGLTQVSGFVVTVVLLLACGVATGSQEGSRLLPSSGTVTVVAALVAAVGLALLVPPVRRWAAARVLPSLRQVLPRLLDMAQQPSRLAIGIGGNLVVTVSYVVCLYACVQAFGASPSLPAVTIAYLAGAAVASAAPTPGGIGVIDLALASGLRAVGVDGDVAVSATLLFRLITFWARVPPGWITFRWLQRRRLI